MSLAITFIHTGEESSVVLFQPACYFKELLGLSMIHFLWQEMWVLLLPMERNHGKIHQKSCKTVKLSTNGKIQCSCFPCCEQMYALNCVVHSQMAIKQNPNECWIKWFQWNICQVFTEYYGELSGFKEKEKYTWTMLFCNISCHTKCIW